jgi:hypothetical protein
MAGPHDGVVLSTGGAPAGSAGQVQFNNGSGGLGADANLFWDNTNKRLGIGTSAPGAALSVDRDGGANEPLVALQNTGTETGASVLDVFTSGRSDGFTDGYIAQFRNAAGTKMYIRGDGLIGMGPNHTTPSAQLDIAPAAGVQALNTTQTALPSLNAGSGASNFNTVTITDNCNFTGNVMNGFQVNHNVGGPTFAGSRQALSASISLNNSIPAGQTFIVGLFSGAFCAANAGGTNTGAGASGSIVAANPSVQVFPAATNLFEATGMEVNVLALTGSSMKGRFGIRIADESGSAQLPAIQGAHFDAALQITSQPNAAGFKAGITFDSLWAQAPISSGGTAILVNGAQTMGSFIDASAATVTGNFITGPGSTFFVDANGVVHSPIFSETSDRRKKKDIEEDTKYGLADLLRIKVRDAGLVSADVKSPTVIAQELQAIVPEAVTTDTDGFLGIKYSGTLVPLLIKSLQELSDKVDRLEKALKAAQDRPAI